eukprot:GHVL01004245.1.p1 GENE.GHVL01004245.1~~GHVL01004245.1.p1  ORF type:complete len:115 (-),score=26.50 GHVL01004245.1:5-349(-)
MIGQNAAYEASADIPDYDFELDDIQYDEMIFKALYKENTIEPHNNDTIEVIDKFIAEANEKYINESQAPSVETHLAHQMEVTIFCKKQKIKNKILMFKNITKIKLTVPLKRWFS